MPDAHAEVPAQLRVALDDASAVSEARRKAAAVARALQFGETPAGQLALGVTEVATNVVKHAGRGELLVRPIGEEAIEVVAIDSGPGMADLAESFRDGYSTAGSPGTGLGSLLRMTSGLEVLSSRGAGTIVRFEVRRGSAPAPKGQAVGVVCLPKPGETECGDGWTVVDVNGRRLLFVVDGLGHGPEAAKAARAAIAAVQANAAREPAELLKAVDAMLRATRGAAACAALLDPAAGECVFCGIGNISAAILANGASRSMVSHGGILGMQMARYQEFRYPLPRGALVILHSDGITSRWTLEGTPGLAARHPSVIAAWLYRDHSRGRDDVTALAVRAG